MIRKQSLIFLLLSISLVSADDLDQPYNRVGYQQEGNASFYADKFHGRKTASGEFYDMYEMTAAHPRIRFNTKIKVTNLKNDKSIIVRINDRGPYSGGRIIDLSKSAAQKLDMIRDGVIPVKTEVIEKEEFPVFVDKKEKESEKVVLEKTKEKEKNKQKSTKKKTKVGRLLDKVFNKNKQTPQPQERPKTEGNTQKQEEQVTPQNDKQPKDKPNKGGVIDKPQQKVKAKSNEEKFAGVNTYSIWGTIKYPDGFGVQIASYSILDKALEKAKVVYEKGFKDVFIQTGWAGDKRIYRILVGEGSSETVSATIPQLRASGFNGFVKQH
nr:septal ring lytic transglycosylase RlpA family protein [Thermoflexibacter sp.]